MTTPPAQTTPEASGWNKREPDDPTLVNWPDRTRSALIPYEVTDGKPVNPCETTVIPEGRNGLPRWAENKMADALITLTCDNSRLLLMVQRNDGSWATPGGKIKPGEDPVTAGLRELFEETTLDLRGMPLPVTRLPFRYVPDPRATRRSWAVTTPVCVDLGDLGRRGVPPHVEGADDARSAAWVAADTYTGLCAELGEHGEQVFAAHVEMLGTFINDLNTSGSPSAGLRVVGLTCITATAADFVATEAARTGNRDHTTRVHGRRVFITYFDKRYPLDVAAWALEHGCADDDAAAVVIAGL